MTRAAESVTCPTGKELLTRAEAAQRAAWWRRARFARMEHYRCSRCGSYHVGNDRRKKAAKGRAW